MAFKRPMARILERTITAGNGPYALSAVDNSYNRFSSFMSVGDTTWAMVVEPGVAFWTGQVTYSAANQITLTTVEEAAGTFGSGTKEIFAGALAGFHEPIPLDWAGIITTAGSASAYAATSFRVYDTLSRLNNRVIAFTPHVTSAAAPTLSVDGLASKVIRAVPAVDLLPGVLIQGTPYSVVYNNADQAFYLHNFHGNPYNVPLGAGMDYWGPTTPNSAFAFPIGQAISRTTYAALFALIGTTYGPGDGSTTFNLPDKRGRVSAAADASAGRITATVTSAAAGGTGGAETNTLSTTNLPAYTPTGTISGTVTNNDEVLVNGTAVNGNVANGSGGGFDWNNLPVKKTIGAGSSFSGSVSMNAQGGASTAFTNLQPTIVCNYIMRIL